MTEDEQKINKYQIEKMINKEPIDKTLSGLPGLTSPYDLL